MKLKFKEIIRGNRHALAIDSIHYLKLDGEEYYVQEIFDSADLLTNLDRNGEEKLYFILETKGTANLFDLRTPEQLKIIA